MNNILHKKNIVLAKLSGFIYKEKLNVLKIGILKLFIWCLLIFGVLSFFENFNYFGTSIKFIFFILFSVTVIVFFIIWILIPVIKLFKKNSFDNYQKAAIKIGNHFNGIKDKLVNSLQLLEDRNASSLKLTEAAFETVYKTIENLDFLNIIDYSKVKKMFRIFFAVFSIAFFSLLVFPQMRSATLRLIHFNTQYSKPSEFILKVLTGNVKTKKGKNVTIKVKAIGKIPEQVSILTKTKFETEFSEHKVTPDSNNVFTLNLNNVQNSFTYFALSKNIKTITFSVKVLNPPIVNYLHLDIFPPRYSHIHSFSQDDNGNVSVLSGTKILFKIKSTKKLSAANLVKNNKQKINFKINGNTAKRKITVLKDFNYFISLRDIDGNKNENPVNYNIKILTDNFPFINITSPEKNFLLPQNDLVNIKGTIKDDFGFSKLMLNYKITKTVADTSDKFTSVNIPIKQTQPEQNFFYEWNLLKLGVREKNFISFYLEIFDNDDINGPKSTKSEMFKIRVPSLDELFTQAEISQNNSIKKLKETLKESEELGKNIKELSNKLKQKQKKIDWNEKEKLQKTLENFKRLSEKNNDIRTGINKLKQEMMKNNLISEETMKKYNELQNLMNELNSKDLQKALNKMQKALESLNRNKVQNNLENFAANEEAFKKSIERTLNLLKQIQIEQKIDEIIKRTEKLTKDIKNLSEKTERNKSNKDLTDKQKNIDEQLKNLQKEISKLNDKMKEINDMPKDKTEEIKKEFEKQNNQEISKQTLEQLQKNNLQKALQNMRQLDKNIKTTMNRMQQLKQQMQMQNQQMVMQNMMKTINDLISLSKEEEKLQQETEKNKMRSSELPKTAEAQMNVSENLNNILKRLNKLSQKTFAITPEMGKYLGEAKQSMKQAIAGLQNGNGNQASYKQNESMKNLNQAALLMQNSLKQMMQGGGNGSGMMSLMQQLQNLSQQQLGLNKLTQQLKQGQLSFQQLSSMQRLAEKQSQIQKSLEQLNKEAKQSGQSKKIASDLDKILEDMQEVISDFNSKKINDKLIHKQEKILTKLLDAQRSINERDFEKKRESEKGKNFNIKSPVQLNLSDTKIKDKLRDELLRAVKEGYSKDYQELIRKYFEQLKNIKGN